MTAMRKTIKASLIASAIAMLPLGSQAAGLGAIHVFSGLGQPLRAEIELNATAEELKSLSAVVASPEAFRRANLQYSSAMTSLRLAVEQRGSRAVVKLTSDKPLNEPFVDVLLELNWASGSLLREYTFLLDPVPVAPPAPVAARPAAAPAPAPAPAPPAPSAATPARPAVMAGTYAVQRGDTLRRVAEASRPADVTLDQMLIALFRENPEAFDGGNMNRLRAGSVLTVPDGDAVRAVDPTRARQEVQAQAADFNAYRARLAGAVAARPVAESPPTRGDAGTIVPKVTEPAERATGDRVKVSGGRDDQAAGRGEDPRLARLQALEEELAARDKALEEANSRLAALEESLRQMQQLLELRSGSMAQLQQQAAGGAPAAAPTTAQTAAPAAPAAPAEPKPPAAAPAESAASKPAGQPAPKPAAKAPAPAEASLLQTLLDDPMVLAGGGGILALLLAYAGLKVRQRRQQAAQGAAAAASQFSVEPNSVFGKTGGQSVNTGESSVLHTDFSQSGLSAIDTDEGVDPVAEADVYMAYGRDAQAEEILLDALKSDSSRLAIYLKLLEIYAQRNNLKAFEATATDLYSRTGGEGSDWAKAAEMGRRLDPDNPLYQAKTGDAQMSAAAGGALGAAAAVAGAAAHAIADEEPLTAPLPSVDIPSEEVPELSVELEALPQVDEGALDFDLDAGLGLSADEGAGGTAAQGASAMQAFPPDALAASDAMEIDLDLGAQPEEAAPSVAELRPAQMNETVVGEGLEFAAADQGLEFDLGTETPAPAPVPESAEFNLDATMLRTAEASEPAEEAASDLEKTTFDSSLLDFDFNLGDAESPAAAEPSQAFESPESPESPAIPPLDLSGIDLELDSTAVATDAPGLPSETAPAAETAAGPEPSPELLEEVNTKLELARAYEEMGDSDGARELLDEVMREGSAEQRETAARLLERLG